MLLEKRFIFIFNSCVEVGLFCRFPDNRRTVSEKPLTGVKKKHRGSVDSGGINPTSLERLRYSSEGYIVAYVW
jgi:hypothetical protein